MIKQSTKKIRQSYLENIQSYMNSIVCFAFYLFLLLLVFSFPFAFLFFALFGSFYAATYIATDGMILLENVKDTTGLHFVWGMCAKIRVFLGWSIQHPFITSFSLVLMLTLLMAVIIVPAIRKQN